MKNYLIHLPIKKQQSLPALSIFIIALLCFFFDASIEDSLVFNRRLISQGEYWRLFSGHFLHTNGYHLLLNLSALLLLWALHGNFYHYKNYSLLFTFCALFCSAALYFLSPDIKQYVGLSGVLHGIFVFGAIMDIRNGDKTGYLLFIGVWLKILDEQYFGASTDVVDLIEANVAIDAHLWGALSGLIFTITYCSWQKLTKE